KDDLVAVGHGKRLAIVGKTQDRVIASFSQRQLLQRLSRRNVPYSDVLALLRGDKLAVRGNGMPTRVSTEKRRISLPEARSQTMTAPSLRASSVLSSWPKANETVSPTTRRRVEPSRATTPSGNRSPCASTRDFAFCAGNSATALSSNRPTN